MMNMYNIWSEREVDWNLTIRRTEDSGGGTIIWSSLSHKVLNMHTVALLLILTLTMTDIHGAILYDAELAGEWRSIRTLVLIDRKSLVVSNSLKLEFIRIGFIQKKRLWNFKTLVLQPIRKILPWKP